MNLINKRLLNQKFANFNFPSGAKKEKISKLINGWQIALRESDLEKTKEKSIQGKFLITFFEEILGYSDVTSGQKEWTLIQHPRTENDDLEPDGSLGWFTTNQKQTKVVIELKDANTILDKKQSINYGRFTPIEQAYLYSTKYSGCNWIIVSNFKEIRLFNKQKTQIFHERFDVLQLHNDDEFKRFYYLLCQENLISKDKESQIDLLAKDTTEAEVDITKIFYSDYKEVRLSLFDHLVNNNPQISKEIILEKTQKLLDRLIFALFCEDTSNLLPINIIKDTYDSAIKSLSPSDERVWRNFQDLFHAIDQGNSRVKPLINAYNGGLFSLDSVLDSLHVKDEFWVKVMKLATYNFETELNVNILGHIFEQSISDIESLKSEINGENQDKKISKRKKEGIFYTPEIITHFMIVNTIGKYLEEYPDKLESIKVLDPACGSGAFLNQAHSFLKTQWNIAYQEGRVKHKDAEYGVIFDINPIDLDKSIFLRNLYGVDINQESVDITKLALWLKTANATERLQNLDKNIKSGNSLVDDVNVAGVKAFNWSDEFYEVMKNGGFDIIVGNPPWVFTRGQNYPEDFKDYISHYLSSVGVYKEGKSKSDQSGKINLYAIFIVKSIQLLRDDGLLAFIIPNNILRTTTYDAVRRYLLEKTTIVQIVDCGGKVFEGVTASSIILIVKKQEPTKDHKIQIITKIDVLDIDKGNENYLLQSSFLNNPSAAINIFSDKHSIIISEKIHQNSVPLGKISKYIIEGIVGSIERDVKDYRIDDTYKPFIVGKDIGRYSIEYKNKYIHYDRNVLHRARPEEVFINPKILVQRISGGTCPLKAVLDTKGYYAFASLNCIQLDNSDFSLEYITAILNSKLLNYYYSTNYSNQSTLTVNISKTYLSQLPIKIINLETQKKIINIVLEVQNKNTTLIEKEISYREYLLNEYSIDAKNMDITLGWNEFKVILNKQKISMSLNRMEELFNWFRLKQNEFQEHRNMINILENKIDEEMFVIYGIDDEDRKVIKESTSK